MKFNIFKVTCVKSQLKPKIYFSQLYLGVLIFLNQFYNSFIEITYIFNKLWEWLIA